MPALEPAQAEKVREVIPLGPKVITANTLKFKPIFECSLLKMVGRFRSDNCSIEEFDFELIWRHLLQALVGESATESSLHPVA